MQIMAADLFATGNLPLGTEIDALDLTDSVPSALELGAYDAVVVWSSGVTPFAYADSLGNALGQYADAGGGVVIAIGAILDNAWGLGGTIMTAGYCPLHKTSMAGISGARTLDVSTISFPYHPIFNGTDVQNFAFTGGNFLPAPPLDTGAILLAADSQGANSIAINMYLAQEFAAEMANVITFTGNALLFVGGAF